MTKDAYFFSHDSNARNDPKIAAMRGEYGTEGYGWFWMIVEMMRETDGYKLDMHNKYVWNAYALQMQCTKDAAKKFIEDCIDYFKLFECDGEYFWSTSLMKRMGKLDEVREKRRAAANARWNVDANALQVESISNASKVKESKEKENTLKDMDANASKRFIKPTVEKVLEYCQERKNNIDANKFIDHYESNGWKVGPNAMKDWKAAVRTWEKKSTPSISNNRTSIPTPPKEFVPTPEDDARMERYRRAMENVQH